MKLLQTSLLPLLMVTGVLSNPLAQQPQLLGQRGYCREAGECLVYYLEESGRVRDVVAQVSFFFFQSDASAHSHGSYSSSPSPFGSTTTDIKYRSYSVRMHEETHYLSRSSRVPRI